MQEHTKFSTKKVQSVQETEKPEIPEFVKIAFLVGLSAFLVQLVKGIDDFIVGK